MSSEHEDRFRATRLTKGDVASLMALSTRARSDKGELMGIVAALGSRPVGTFDGAGGLAGGLTRGAAPATIRVLQTFFVGLANRDLQAIYRAHLPSMPSTGLTHDDRIDQFDAIRDDAVRCVRMFDWKWLSDWLGLETIGQGVASSLDQLSNFAFPYWRVNFRFTYHCNIACRHCYNESGPDAKAAHLELASMFRIIEQMPGAGIHALNLTGGEPFLYTDELAALIAAGRAQNLSEISIYTNAFWATTPERAREILARLEQAGFKRESRDHLKVSAGVYHQEFIGLDRIATLARVYQQAYGDRLPVYFELDPVDPQSQEKAERQLAEAGVRHSAKLFFHRARPLGRGRELDAGTMAPITQPCGVIDQLVFDPDGSARPCCGFNNENHGIKVGDIQRHSLRQLVKRMQNDPLLQFLAKHPMSDVFRHVDTPARAGGYAGTCDLCQHALGGVRDKQALQAKLFGDQEFYPFWFSSADLG